MNHQYCTVHRSAQLLTKQYPPQKAHSGELNGHSRIDRNKNRSNKNKDKNESAYWWSIYINDGGYLFDWNVLSIVQQSNQMLQSLNRRHNSMSLVFLSEKNDAWNVSDKSSQICHSISFLYSIDGLSSHVEIKTLDLYENDTISK